MLALEKAFSLQAVHRGHALTDQLSGMPQWTADLIKMTININHDSSQRLKSTKKGRVSGMTAGSALYSSSFAALVFCVFTKAAMAVTSSRKQYDFKKRYYMI